MGSYVRKADRDHVMAIGECRYCGSKNDLAVDHILPVYLGGGGERSNLTCSCRRCNGIKTAFPIEEFLTRVIIKRAHCRKLAAKYLRKARRIRMGPDYRICIDRITDLRIDHSYFTRVIRAIQLQTYILNG
jgi:hypothetical protein